MPINHNKIRDILLALNYESKKGGLYQKSYKQGYKIAVDFNEEKINYPRPNRTQ